MGKDFNDSKLLGVSNTSSCEGKLTKMDFGGNTITQLSVGEKHAAAVDSKIEITKVREQFTLGGDQCQVSSGCRGM